MLARVPTKCFGVFFVIFLMCPKRTRLNVPIGNQQEYYHAVRRSNLKISDDLLPALRAVNSPYPINENEHQNLASELSFKDSEPGFDLTDEEIEKFKLWDNGLVPYYIDVPSFADKVLRDKIRWFLNMVSSLTSLNFMELPRPPTDDETRWVFFVNRRSQLGCADHSVLNFTTRGVQRVLLGYECMSIGGELAEAVLSIAGVPPQHNAPNRDDYIEVVNENIIPEKRYLFKKLKNTEWLFHDVEYDFASASHFHHHKHSANGRATIKTKSLSQGITTEKRGFSQKDIWKIKMLYNYIVKSKKSRNKVTECSKLFSKGKKFKNMTFNNQEIIPHPKPDKYLGTVSANTKNDDDDDNESISEKEIDTKNTSVKKGRNLFVEASDRKDAPGFRSQVEESLFGLNKKSSRPQNKPPSAKNVYKDPFTYLSDYQTGDENYQRSILKKTNDYNSFGKLAKFWKKESE